MHFPPRALVPLRQSTKCIRKCWCVWILKWIRELDTGGRLTLGLKSNRGSCACEGGVWVRCWCLQAAGSQMPWMPSPPQCEGLQTVGFSLNVTVRCMVSLSRWQQIVLPGMLNFKFIKEQGLAVHWVLKRQWINQFWFGLGWSWCWMFGARTSSLRDEHTMVLIYWKYSFSNHLCYS